MPEMALTIHCARGDVEALVQAIRRVSHAPVHVREEAVHGRDFDDASTAERVTGELQRAAIELLVPEGDVPAVLAAARGARRRLPIRWQSIAVSSSGRFE